MSRKKFHNFYFGLLENKLISQLVLGSLFAIKMTDKENQESVDSTDVEITDPLDTKITGVKNQESNDSMPPLCDICEIRQGIK